MFTSAIDTLPASYYSPSFEIPQFREEIYKVVKELENDPRVQGLPREQRDEFRSRIRHNAEAIKAQLARLLDSGTTPDTMRENITYYTSMLIGTADEFRSSCQETSRLRGKVDHETTALSERLSSTHLNFAPFPTVVAGAATGGLIADLGYDVWQASLPKASARATQAAAVAQYNLTVASARRLAADAVQHAARASAYGADITQRTVAGTTQAMVNTALHGIEMNAARSLVVDATCEAGVAMGEAEGIGGHFLKKAEEDVHRIIDHTKEKLKAVVTNPEAAKAVGPALHAEVKREMVAEAAASRTAKSARRVAVKAAARAGATNGAVRVGVVATGAFLGGAAAYLAPAALTLVTCPDELGHDDYVEGPPNDQRILPCPSQQSH